MNLEAEEIAEAVDYYCRIMTEEDILQIKTLMRKIHMVPAKPRRYLQRRCRTLQDLEDLFKENSHLFHMENGRVALYNYQDQVRDEAIEYFRDVLERYEEPVNFMELKRQHLKNASDGIQNYITGFYPIKEFRQFLKSRPDVFVVYKNQTVFLIDVQSVAYYERRLELYGAPGLSFMRFRGHIGFAPVEVQEYINRYYPDDDFQIFLRRHSDVFVLDDEGCVSLAPLA